jgi:hypothetical protein
MLRNVKDPGKKIANMAALYWSLSSDYFDEGDKDLLVGTYVGDGWAGNKEDIVTISKLIIANGDDTRTISRQV